MKKILLALAFCLLGALPSHAQQSAQIQIPCASTINIPLFQYPTITDVFINLTCNISSVTLSGTLQQGMEVTISLTQDSVGGRTFAWPTNFVANATPIVASTPNLSTTSTWQYCGNFGFGNSCPAGFWQNTDQGPAGSTIPINSPGIPQANGNIYYASNYGALADGQVVFDAVCSNGSNIVTSATAHFTTKLLWNGKANTRVGQIVWTVAGGGGGGNQSMAKTTIQSIDSDSQIHTVANGNASCGAGNVLVWGDDDTAALNTTWSHVIGDTLNCGSMQLPLGMMLISGAIANTLPVGGASNPCTFNLLNPTIQGFAWQNSVFAPTPDYDLTTCSGAGKDNSCFGIGFAELANFDVLGFGINQTTVPGTTANVFHLHSPNMMYNVSCQEWAQNDPNLTNVFNDFSLAYSQFGQYFACGGQGPTFNSASIAGPVIGSYAGAGNTQPVLVQSGSPGLDYFSNWFNGGAASQCYVIASGFGNFFGEAVPSNSTGGAMCVDAGNVSLTGGSYIHNQAIATRIAVRATAAGTIRACGNRIIDNGAGEFALTIDATSAFYSCGNNNYSGIINIVPGGVFVGPEANNGFCTGVATASSTLGLYGLGENTVLTCTSTTTNLGVPARKAGTLTGLNVTASSAGVNASSGVVTVLKNNVATAVTCTIGTGTNCQDNTHSAAVVFGDIISIQFTTQAADTLAGIKAQVILE